VTIPKALQTNNYNMTNNSKHKNVLLLFCLLFLMSCNHNSNKKTTPNIHVSYFKGLTETIIPVKCGEIIARPRFDYKIDTVITDEQLIDKIVNQIKSLRPIGGSQYCNVRIDCIINLHSDTIKLCIGDFECILKDGNLMERNDTLLFLIRKYSGYYDYFSQDNLKYFKELDYFSRGHKLN
jgi:hypothetical protein